MAGAGVVGLIKALANIDSAVIKAAIDAWLDDHPEATTTVEDGAITYAKLASALKEILNKKADDDGYYESMTVGDAEQLVATVGVNDKVPYLFRTSGGSADIGDREVDKLVGGSFAWNQLVQNGDFSNGATGWASQSPGSALSVANGVATVKHNSGQLQPYNPAIACIVPGVLNHVYFINVDAKIPVDGSLYFGGNSTTNGIPSNKFPVVADTWTENKVILKPSTLSTEGYLFAYIGVYGASITLSSGAEISFRKIQVIDLTQLFGSTIADYIYSLETSTPGAGVAWFRKLFPKPYYAYNAGKMESVCADLHKMTGFNAYNPETGKAKVLGGYQYEIVGTYTSLSLDGETITPVSGKFTPAKDGEITVTGGDSTTTCIHLVWDGERDGEYEPYVAHSYDLDPVVLRGIPKLDAGNKLYYDGDTYEADGTVTRRFAEVDLGTLSYYRTNSGGIYAFTSSLDPAAKARSAATDPSTGSVSKGYDFVKTIYVSNMTDKTWMISGNGQLYIRDDAYTDAASFKTAMSGVKLVYELATPTTEEANPYQTPQIVDDWGTEEYVDALATAATNPRDVAIPVGHDTTYRNNLRAKLEMAPESPSGDGDYILRQTSGQNEYVLLEKELPSLPSEDGTYTLKCTVSGSTKTLTWESDAE